MLAERGLPCTIVPMPISGVTCPVNASSNIVMTAAEVLGVMVCLRSAFPEAMVAGGVISGVMDMRTGSASFAAPEAIRQDVGAAMLFERLYGQDFAIGTGYIDALYPGVQSALEIHAKMAAAASIGRHNYPVGLLLGGKRWSPVQAMIGVEMAHYIHEIRKEIAVEADDVPVGLFEEVGIGGNYLGETHTAENFHAAMWMTDLMERTLVAEPGVDRMLEKARQRWSEFVKQEIRPAVSDDRVREIENWKRTAVRILTK
jgi:trimethylamine--corrinoid protein Co-methyltransferase